MVVLDASVILAVFNKESGYEKAQTLLSHSIISTVTLSEVMGILAVKHKIPLKEIKPLMLQIIDTIIPFSQEQAMITTELEKINRENKYGLSIADRACMALGIDMKMPIYTADKIWSEVKYPNLEVHQIR